MARRRSSIDLLPDALREEFRRLVSKDRFTIDEITAHMRKMGADVSRSAVGREVKDFQEASELLQHGAKLSKALVQELGETTGEQGRVLVEMTQALLMRISIEMSRSELDIAQVGPLAKALKDTQAAMKSSVDVELRVRREVTKEAAKVAGAVAKEQGLSAATVDLIKERILGIAPSARPA